MFIAWSKNKIQDLQLVCFALFYTASSAMASQPFPHDFTREIETLRRELRAANQQAEASERRAEERVQSVRTQISFVVCLFVFRNVATLLVLLSVEKGDAHFRTWHVQCAEDALTFSCAFFFA